MKFLSLPIAAALLSVSVQTQAAPLDLDTSFDGDGMLVADYAAVTGGQSLLQDVEITPDEKIIAVGFAQNTGAAVTYNLLLSQYNLDGTLDSNFGTNGIVNLAVESNARGSALVVQPDGKILVTGHSKGASNKWRSYVKRFNEDGSEDANFTTYNYAPSYTYNGQSGVRNTYGKDVALTQDGKILVSVQEEFYAFQTGAGSDTLNRSRIIRLQENGVLDTTFGTNGFTDKADSPSVDSFSYEDEKFSLSNAGEIYVSGRRREAFFSQNNQTMTLSKYNASGNAQSFDGSNAGWARRSNYVFSGQTASSFTDILYSNLVLPNGNVVSAGCIDSGTYFKSRIQQQNSAGSFVTTFSGDGIIDSTMSTQSQRIEHCYRDVNYHPSVGLIAVGGVKNGPFSSHGSLYVSAINETTGASIGLERLGTINEGYLYATATTSAGKIVSVGYMNNPKEAVVIVMEGAPLPAPINTLNPFTFADVTGAALSTTQTASSNVVITPSAALTARVFGGSAVLNSAAVSNTITLNDGDALSLEHTSSATQNTQTSTEIVVNNGAGYHRNNKMWKVGDTFSQFNSTTLVIDTTPDAFSFTDNTDVAPSTMQLSDIITVAGINTSSPITVAQGEYSINGAAFTNAAGSVENGDAIQLRHPSSATFGGLRFTILTIGGVFDDFRSTVEVQDTTPDAFSFAVVNDVSLSAVTESSSITIAGINSPSPISITNGEYKVGSGAYTSAGGNVNNGDVITLRHTSSGSFTTTVTSTLNIDGVTANFASTTEAADTTPDAFNFVAATAVDFSTLTESASITVAGINTATPISISSGEYKIGSGAYTSANGTINNGDVITLRHTSSSASTTTVTSALTIGGVSANFASTTQVLDNTPDAFSFGAFSNVARSSVRQSSAVTLSGINSAAPISISGGAYRINGGPLTSSGGTVNNGDNVQVSHTSSSSFATSVTSTLSIGSVSANFVSTTEAQDTTPDAFSFSPRFNASLNASVQAGLGFAVAGINDATPISIVGGQYRIGNGSFTSANGTVNNGEIVTVRHTASSSFNSTVTSSLSIGGVTASYVSTTVAQDTTPNVFSFTDAQSVVRNTLVEFASFDVLGITGTVAISVANGEYKIGNGSYTNANGTVSNGAEVTVRHTNNSGFGVTIQSSLTIGTESAIFRSTTEAMNTTPAIFTFPVQTGVAVSTDATSSSITVTGINFEAPISIDVGEYSINSGAFTSAAGVVENGDAVAVRHTSAATKGGTVSTELTIGGVTAVFSTTTQPAASASGSGGGGGAMGVYLLSLAGLLAWRRRTK